MLCDSLGVEGFLWKFTHFSGAGPWQIFEDAMVSMKVHHLPLFH